MLFVSLSVTRNKWDSAHSHCIPAAINFPIQAVYGGWQWQQLSQPMPPLAKAPEEGSLTKKQPGLLRSWTILTASTGIKSDLSMLCKYLPELTGRFLNVGLVHKQTPLSRDFGLKGTDFNETEWRKVYSQRMLHTSPLCLYFDIKGFGGPKPDLNLVTMYKLYYTDVGHPVPSPLPKDTILVLTFNEVQGKKDKAREAGLEKQLQGHLQIISKTQKPIQKPSCMLWGETAQVAGVWWRVKSL